MALFRNRLTIRRLMIVIAALAFLLATYIFLMDRQQRNARAQKLNAEINLNQVAQAEARAMAEEARRQHAPPQDVLGHEKDAVDLQKEEGELRQKLSDLQR